MYSRFALRCMNPQLPIPEPLWNTIPAEAQAALLAAWKAMEDRIAELEAAVRDLQARLQLKSTNSNQRRGCRVSGRFRNPAMWRLWLCRTGGVVPGSRAE